MSERLLVASRKGLFDLKRQGDRFEVARTSFLGSPVSMTLRDPRDGALYAALDHGHFGVHLHRSDDDGATWQEIAAPSYVGIEGDPAPSLKLIWALEPSLGDEPGVLWAGTIPGGLFKTTDRGASWTLVRSLWEAPERAQWMGGGADEPGIHSICIDPGDSKHVAIGVSCGGVWETRDGGASWHLEGKGLWAEFMPPEQRDNPAIQDPHRLVQCAAAPEVYWIQHHNGMFHAPNGIAQWDEVKPEGAPNFGFAVAVHPKDAETAWFVPAADDAARYAEGGRVVVTRTRDGGRSFDVLHEGLPQAHAYDLFYRHALDVDDTGDCLAMGSTTGNLWLSENGGDAWTLLNAHFPPIYAVRFC